MYGNNIDKSAKKGVIFKMHPSIVLQRLKTGSWPG